MRKQIRATGGLMLVVLSGLPGTGKTTIGKVLTSRRSAVYVRVDVIEHALRQFSGFDQNIGHAGYLAAFAIAASNLKLGNLVIADSVNPVPASRQGWRDVALSVNGARLVEVEVICSNENEHRRRIEMRATDIDGFKLPTWSSVVSHHYIPWSEPRFLVDTAFLSAHDAASAIEKQINAMSDNQLREP